MFELAHPWVLLCWVIPWCVWFWMPPTSNQGMTALRVPFFDSIKGLLTQSTYRLTRNWWLSFGIFGLVLLAASGPRWVGEPQPLVQEGIAIMLALDISPSMGINDMRVQGHAVTRLSVVQRAAKQFVLDRTGDPFGLIVFGERPYLLTPLTTDRQTVLTRLDDMTVGLAGQTTSLGDALGLAIKRLTSLPANSRMIVLLTDGVSNSGVLSPLKAAQLAHDAGIRVYTIGLGAAASAQTFGGLFFGMNGAADLDEPTLKKMANLTGGRYFRATDFDSLQRIYASINQLSKVPHAHVTLRPQREMYPWPLACALGLFLWMLGSVTEVFRRSGGSR